MRKPAVTDTSVVSKLLRESLQTIYLLFSKTAKWDLNSDLTWHAAKHIFSRLADPSCDRGGSVEHYSILPWCCRGKKIGPGLFEVSHELTQAGTIRITHSAGQIWPIRADNIWGLWNCYSVIRVMVCDEGMKILILTRDDEDMDTWSY